MTRISAWRRCSSPLRRGGGGGGPRFTAGMVAAASLFVPALFTHVYDPSIPIFRVAILLTPFAALPLDGVLRATGHTRYLFRIFFWRLLITIPTVLIGLKLFGMIGAI